MSFDVDAFLRDLAHGLRPRTGQLVQAVVHDLAGVIPEEEKHEDITALGPLSVSEHVTACLDTLERRLDPTEAKVPPATVRYARALARHGLGIDRLLRLHRLGHAGLLSLLYTEAARLTTIRNC